MPRGSLPGERRGGRKKGTPNKRTAATASAIEASGLTPLEYMLSILRDPLKPDEARFEAAKAAAPYVHARLASVEHAGPNGGPMEVTEVRWTVVDPKPIDRPRLHAIAGGKPV